MKKSTLLKIINTNKETVEVLEAIRELIKLINQSDNKRELELYLNKAVNLSRNLELTKVEGELLIELGVFYWSKSNYNLALQKFRLSCTILKETNSAMAIVVATRNVGITYIDLYGLSDSITFLKLSLDLLKQVKDMPISDIQHEKAVINNWLGIAYSKSKNFKDGIDSFFNALRICESNSDDKLTCDININIGLLYNIVGQYKRAMKYFTKSELLAKEIDDSASLIKAYTNMGEIANENNQVKQALDFFFKALDVINRNEDKYQSALSKTMYDIGRCYFNLKEYDKAREFTSNSIQRNKDDSIFEAISERYLLLGNIHFEELDYENAEYCYSIAYETCNKLNTASNLTTRILNSKSRLYAMTQDYKKAYHTLLEDYKITKELSLDEEKRAISEIQSRFESQQQERETIIIKEKNKELELLNRQIDFSNNQLKALSKIDPLTNISSHAEILDRLQVIMVLNERNKDVTCIAFISIDYIKTILVKYDLNITNQVLVHFANVIKESVRNQDFLGRWDNHNFLLILPYTNVEGARHILEKINNNMREQAFNHENKKIYVTATLGATQISSTKEIHESINIAQSALDYGKRNGKDQVVFR